MLFILFEMGMGGQYGSFYSSWPPTQGTTWPIARQTRKA
jgi:hypothetical protein